MTPEETADSIVRQPPDEIDATMYAGLGRQEASRMAMELVRAAERTGRWVYLPDHLLELRKLLKVAA